MRNVNGNVLFSASDLMKFLGCAHATALDLAHLKGIGPVPATATEDAALLQKQGDQHEQNFLNALWTKGKSVTEIVRGSLDQNVRETISALQAGPDYVFQGALAGPLFAGWSDFLERVEKPSLLGKFSYEVVDTKLKRKPHPKHVLQLVIYSDLLTQIQGLAPEYAHVELGNHERATIKLADFSSYAHEITSGNAPCTLRRLRSMPLARSLSFRLG